MPQTVIVVGGGSTARQYQEAARNIGKLTRDDLQSPVSQCEIAWKDFRKMVGNRWNPGMSIDLFQNKLIAEMGAREKISMRSFLEKNLGGQSFIKKDLRNKKTS